MLGSEAIKPEFYRTEKGITSISTGNVIALKQVDVTYTFVCDHAVVALQFLTDGIFRLKMSPSAAVDLAFGAAIEPSAATCRAEVSFEEQAEFYLFRTQSLQVSVQKSPFGLTVLDPSGLVISQDAPHGRGYTEERSTFLIKKSQDENFYGFGEKTGFFNKKGTVQTMWNTDVYAPHNPEVDALYQSIPFFMTEKAGIVCGTFLDNPGKTSFHLNEQDTYRITAETGDLDTYFLYGPTMKEVIRQFSFLTGRMPLPPKWAIGYHQSRYSYETEQEVRDLAANFRAKQIPCDAIYLDIHYMDEYRVFTWHPEHFPEPTQLIADLRTNGFRVVPIVDPGVKVDPKYSVYQEGVAKDHFCKYDGGKLYTGEVWPGESAFPDFTSPVTREWWGKQHEGFVQQGIEGIWNDMNEPAVFNETKTMDVTVLHKNDGDPKTHGELHNLYGRYMSQATYEGLKKSLGGKRPFVLTRAGYAGIQKYAAVWTGDNRSFWEHMQMSIPMILNMGLSGLPFVGADVGGFAFDTHAELLIRWYQLGAFLPYFRNHSAIGFARQEPWSFGPDVEATIKKFIELRYHFLPHLYTLFHEAATTGLPLVRPLLLEDPHDRTAMNLNDQFLLGSSILVAPMLQPGTEHRVVYLPSGEWVNYWTGEEHVGPRHLLVHSPLATMPLFVKAGTLYAGGSLVQSTAEQQEITYHLFKGNGSYLHYEDDGETFQYENGAYNLHEITQSVEGSKLTVQWSTKHQGYELSERVNLQIHHVDEPRAVQATGASSHFDAVSRVLDISLPRAAGRVTIEF